MSRSQTMLKRVLARVDDRGFALVMVLWSAVILALVAGSVTGVSRSDVQLARNITDATRAEVAAKGAARRAFYELAVAAPEAWRTDGTVRTWRQERVELRVAVTEELGRMDINRASPELLARLFDAAGAVRPDELANRIEALRKAHRLATANEPEDETDPLLSELRRGIAFTSVDDLLNVPGVDATLLRRLDPAITVYSGLARPVISAAPPLVRRAMGADPDDAGQAGDGGGRSGLYRIHAEALTDSGAHYALEAVLAYTGGRRAGLPYDIRLWHRAERRFFPLPRS